MLPNKRKCYKKTIFRFWNFWAFFGQKTAKIDKNAENWKNPNCLIKFSETWYVNASQQKKIQQKNKFSIFTFFGIFWPKNSQNWQKMKKIVKIKPFAEIFWNLVSRCFPAKENATKKLFFNFGSFLVFFGQKTVKID